MLMKPHMTDFGYNVCILFLVTRMCRPIKNALFDLMKLYWDTVLEMHSLKF